MFFLGIFISVLILIICIFCTILIYFKLREKYKTRKILNEFIIIAFAFAVSFALRLTSVFMVGIPDSVESGLASGWYVLYSTIGGLSFEGLDSVNEFLAGHSLAQCLYYGSIVYAAITSLLIISVGLSYEFYSFVKTRAFCKQYKTVYVFTMVSEESLLLAQDVQEKENSRLGKNNFAVLFLGDELESFDKRNPLHRTIMDRGFFYWSYGKKENKGSRESVMRFLHFTAEKALKKQCDEVYDKQIHILALGVDENKSGAENVNGDNVFEDIESVLNEYVKVSEAQTDGKNAAVFKINIPTVVNYYLAANGDINYQYYINKLNTVIEAYFAKCGVEVTQDLLTGIKKYFQLHIVSEAYLTGLDLTAQTYGEFFGGGLTEESVARYKSFISPDADGQFRVCSVGFGANGSNAMEQLFVSTSFLDDKTFRASRFIADVYDKSSQEISGRYAYSHPLVFCRNALNRTESDGGLEEWLKRNKNDGLSVIYDKCRESGMTEEQVRDSMGFPVVEFHDGNCFDIDVVGEIGGSDGVLKRPAKAYVIALGNDEENISIANNIIDDFKHEQLLFGADKPDKTLKIIYVNLRDEKNAERLNWTSRDREYFKDSLAVIAFGGAKNVWSYQSIIDDDKDSIYNYLYSLNDPYGEKVQPDPFENMDLYVKKCREYRDAWLRLDPFKKESCRAARTFALNYKITAMENKSGEYSDRLEHLRWNRFHIVNGWIYAPYSKGEKPFRQHNKEHNCLCPFELLDEGTIKYDSVNVALGRII